MRLLYVTASMPFGIGESFLIPEVREILRQGHEVLIVPRSPPRAIGHGDAECLRSRTLRSGLVSVELRLDRAGPIASGSPASVSFAAASAVPAADARQRIPAEALIDAGVGSADVWVIDGSGRARRRTVRFYGFDDRDAIVGGLPAGTRVITTGAGFVAEGQAVQVTA